MMNDDVSDPDVDNLNLRLRLLGRFCTEMVMISQETECKKEIDPKSLGAWEFQKFVSSATFIIKPSTGSVD